MRRNSTLAPLSQRGVGGISSDTGQEFMQGSISMDCMKRTRAMCLLAASSVLMAALMTFVSPILDLSCGGDPGHVVASRGDPFRSSSGVTPAFSPSPCDHTTAPVLPTAPGQHEGDNIHVHGMTAQALMGISATALPLGTPVLLSSPSAPHLSTASVQPPVRPPRISA